MNDNESWLNDLQKQVDDAHHTTDRAESPPPGLWSSIRAQAQPIEEPKEKQPMISTVIMPQTLSNPVRSRPIGQEGGFRHYASLVATVALVLAVAVGGWLAMSQMPGGSGEGKFAILGQTDTGTCDAEPLTVDRVMEIVKNPYLFMDGGPTDDPTQTESPNNPLLTGYREADASTLVLLINSELPGPDEQHIEAAGNVADLYLQCLLYGTLGQAWVFYSPVHIQADILNEFPVFADEDTVRTRVEERLELPAYDADLYLSSSIPEYSPAAVSINPDLDLSVGNGLTSHRFEYLISFGVSFTGSDGKEIYLTTGTGNELVAPEQRGQFGIRVSVAKHRFSDAWYVVPYWLAQ